MVKKVPQYWSDAIRHLSSDKVLKKIINNYKGETLVSRGDAFETLLRSIVGQQISVKAAATIWDRLVKTIKSAKVDNLLEANPADLKAAGLSERKITYCQDLAQHFKTGKINTRNWHKLSDEEIINELVAVKGIGRWTAEMFLIFYLLRPDVYPIADLGLQKAISKNFNKKYPMSEKVMLKLAKNWQPYRTVATWYLWRALDPLPVEY